MCSLKNKVLTLFHGKGFQELWSCKRKYSTMKIILILMCICIISQEASTSDSPDLLKHPKSEDQRTKRQVNSLPLIYPYGGTYKLLVGMALPVPNKDEISLVFAANFQYQYAQFTNITDLSQYYFIKEVSREERDSEIRHRRDERLTFYRSFANMLESQGMNGVECVLRAICEAAQYPVADEGLFGEIIHILLNPDYGRSLFDDVDPDWEESMSIYRDAATAGRQMFSCPAIYPNCPEGQGVMELISEISEE